MFPIAGQTAGPNGLNFMWTLIGDRGVLKAKKIRHFFLSIFYFFFENFFFHGQRRALQLVYKYIYMSEDLYYIEIMFILVLYRDNVYPCMQKTWRFTFIVLVLVFLFSNGCRENKDLQ